MSARRDSLLVLIVHNVLLGFVSGLAVDAVWWLVTGRLPSVLTTVIVANAVTTVGGWWQAARARRESQAIRDAWERPALGEGIGLPHRPDEDGAA